MDNDHLASTFFFLLEYVSFEGLCYSSLVLITAGKSSQYSPEKQHTHHPNDHLLVYQASQLGHVTFHLDLDSYFRLLPLTILRTDFSSAKAGYLFKKARKDHRYKIYQCTIVNIFSTHHF